MERKKIMLILGGLILFALIMTVVSIFLLDDSSDTVNEPVLNATENTTVAEPPVNETPVTSEGQMPDLIVVSVTLANAGCGGNEDLNTTEENETETSDIVCNMSITTVIKNNGIVATDKEFLVYILDATGAAKIIDIITPGSLAPLEEKTINTKYENLDEGLYWIQARTDPTKKIDEADEANNNLAASITIES